MENLLKRLTKIKNTLPKKQGKLCEYIIENGKSVYLMPVSNLADAAGVGRATVIRLVERLGFSAYSEFKKELNASYYVSRSARRSGTAAAADGRCVIPAPANQ